MNNRGNAVLHVSFITFWAVIYILNLWITSSWEGWGHAGIPMGTPISLKNIYIHVHVYDWRLTFFLWTKTAFPFYMQEKYPGNLRRNLFVFNVFLRCVGSLRKRQLKLQTSKLYEFFHHRWRSKSQQKYLANINGIH